MSNPKYFDISELLQSDTAVSKKIPNLPSWEIVEHLRELAFFLDDIREAWGSGIVISSGFRSPKLNKAVGGVSNSGHLTGYACDMVPANGKMKEFEIFLKDYLKGKAFDECLWESNSKGKKWVHFALYSITGKQRKKVFGLEVK